MPHTKADVMAAFHDAQKALEKVNNILRGSMAANEKAVASNENAMRGMFAATTLIKEIEEPPLDLDQVATTSHFVRGLAEKLGG